MPLWPADSQTVFKSCTAVLRIWDDYPGSQFFHPGSWIPDPVSRVKKIPDPDSDPHQIIQVFLTQKIVSKLSEICSGMFIRDPDLDFLSILDYVSRIQGYKRPRIRILNTTAY
jgi:hypothetical protein